MTKTSVAASADATVTMGKTASSNNGLQKELTVQLDAAEPEKNKVAYLWFDVSKITLTKTKKVLLKINGYTNKTDVPFRLHVYGIPTTKWNQQDLAWSNAPLLDDKEALLKEVGQKAFIAGEIAFTSQPHDHFLDVTEAMKKHAGKGISFVLVRETRQLGDDEDKGKKVIISSSESNEKPMLLYWHTK